jgi:hypothetical protein
MNITRDGPLEAVIEALEYSLIHIQVGWLCSSDIRYGTPQMNSHQDIISIRTSSKRAINKHAISS